MKDWKPVPAPLMTRWAEAIDPDNVLGEYPRPQLTRPAWASLNGLWEYAIAPKTQPAVDEYQGQILVPFPLESALSGVKRALPPNQRLWYRRSFDIPADWGGQRVLLHFGAVDWEATVWVNGRRVGVHRGGYDPFSFEITACLGHPGESNELVVAVWDPTDSHWQPRGKQVLNPDKIWYTAVSGIWQTVWLEAVPQTYIHGLRMTPDIDAQQLDLGVTIAGDWENVFVHAEVQEAGALVTAASSPAGESLTLPIPEPRLWSPDLPHLYDLAVSLRRAGEEIDSVTSYFAMRKFSLGPDSQGDIRLCLNNQPLFQFGPLDQGYWPDGLYTPPSEAAMLFDIETCKRLGFNMIRKHIKVEPARYYYHCDRLGLIVWQDMPNGAFANIGAPSLIAMAMGVQLRDHHRLQRFGRQDPASRDNFRQELKAMIDALYNAPCIGMWVPFNEGWGQFNAGEIAAWLKDYDPTRPVDHASGWHDQGAGDVKSIHTYVKKLKPVEPETARAVILSEFGGYSLKLAGHIWDPAMEFGYKKIEDPETLTEAYLDLLEDQLKPWIEAGLSGAVYTQTTDVEIEINGYLTYDRQVEKMDFERLAALHRELYSIR